MAIEDPARKGGVYAAGKFQGKPFFGRLQENGEPDPSYWFVDRLKEMPTAIVPLKSGELYLGGIQELDGKPVKLLVRLKADGSIDESFDLGVGFEKCSRNLHYIEPAVDAVYRMSDANDDILVLGDFWSLNSVTSPYAARVNRQGKVVELLSDTRMSWAR